MVTADQVAERFFHRDSGKPAGWAAYRRLAALSDLNLIRRDRILWDQPEVIRVTGPGARVADIGLRPADLVLSHIVRAITLVNVLESALANNPGATLITERELRERRLQDGRDGKPVSLGRLPGGELRLASGKKIALEVSVTWTRLENVERIINHYSLSDEHYDEVWWYVGGRRVAQRIRDIVRTKQAEDLIAVKEWLPWWPVTRSSAKVIRCSVCGRGVH